MALRLCLVVTLQGVRLDTDPLAPRSSIVRSPEFSILPVFVPEPHMLRRNGRFGALLAVQQRSTSFLGEVGSPGHPGGMNIRPLLS